MKEAIEFVECPQCAAKPGTPALCTSCLRNRHTIDEMKKHRRTGRERVKALLEAIDRSRGVIAEHGANGLSTLDNLARLARDVGLTVGEVYVHDGEEISMPLEPQQKPLDGFAGKLVAIAERGIAELEGNHAELCRVLRLAVAAMNEAWNVPVEIAPVMCWSGVSYELRIAAVKQVTHGVPMEYGGFRLVTVQLSNQGFPVEVHGYDYHSGNAVTCCDSEQFKEFLVRMAAAKEVKEAVATARFVLGRRPELWLMGKEPVDMEPADA